MIQPVVKSISICKVWDSEYPWDVRVEKVALALQRRGHRVHIAARNRDARPLEESLPEGTVHRLAPIGFLGRRANAVSMFPAFFNPRWTSLIRSICRSQKSQVILCRDLPLAPAAIRVGRQLRLPVILDMAENYPAMIADRWQGGHQKPLDWFVRNPAAVAAVERWVLKRVDHTIVVVEESRDRLVQLGVPASRITVVSNTPSLTRLSSLASSNEKGPNDPLELFYLGLLETPRGIGVLLDAMAICQQKGHNIRLSIYGDGSEAEMFRQQAKTLNLSERVIFHGFVPYAQALKAMLSADVGLVPHFANESWNTTIPNKLFDYMAAGLPVLSSDALPTARVVRTTGSGEVFRNRDAGDLAAAIIRLMDPVRRKDAAAAGRAAIASTYNWEADAMRLFQTVEQLVTESPLHK